MGVESKMEVTWLDGVDILDGSGCLTEQGESLLRQRWYDERLAIVTLLGSRATTMGRRRLIAELLDGATPSTVSPGPGAGVALLSAAAFDEEDYQMLILDVGDASSPVIGALCTLSSLVISTADTATAIANALPAFPPFQEALLMLERELTAVEVYDALPSMLTMDFSSDNSLRPPPNALSCLSPSLASMVRLKALEMCSAGDFVQSAGSSLIIRNAKVKRLFGCDVTGELLLSVFKTFARDVGDGHEPDLYSAWDEYVERKCRAVAEDAMATYVDCIQSSMGDNSVPVELDAFEALHDELWKLAMDVFRSGTALLKAPSRRAVRAKLKSDLKQRHLEELKTLRANSRSFCDTLRRDLWCELSSRTFQPNDNGDSDDVTNNSQLFREALNAIHRFDSAFKEQARGPEQEAVLCDFYRTDAVELFRKLEDIVIRRVTDKHLSGLRETLESEFEHKKATLIDRFKREEEQLRASVAREIEMMQKLHDAKKSRVKIDETESKRLKDEVTELRSVKASLESRHVILEHAVEDLTQQNVFLDNKVRDLEQSVRQEMGSRAELVDTLSATIKSAEEKEKQLLDRIADLKVEVKEKASRIENELHELTLQQRKTSEEKEEMQKKLSEFYLRVTALPPALQQHLFCDGTEAKEPVGFADALSSFMS